MKFASKKSKGQLLLTLSLLLFGLASSSEPPSITRISLDPLFQDHHLHGSVHGGTKLYILGTGFDMLHFKNEVSVGILPCVVDYYFSNDSLLVCDMPNIFMGTHKNQEVSVRVDGVLASCNSGDCTMNLELKYTPMLYSIDPQAVFAGDQVNVRGVWRVNRLSDVKAVNISGRNCLLTEAQVEEDTLNYWHKTAISCQVPEDMENGDHTLSVTSGKGTGFDHPRRESFGFKVGTETEQYNLRVLPKIDKVSSNSGFLGGQVLEITGRGLGEDASKVSVKLEDLDCHVIGLRREIFTVLDEENNEVEKSEERLTCELQPIAAPFTNKLFKGGAGFRNKVFEGYNRSLSGMWGENISRTLKFDRTLLSLENSFNMDYYVQKLYGVFRSREAGTYTFKIAGDDQTKLFLSTAPLDYSVDFDEASMLTKHCEISGWTHFREWYREDGQFCDVELEADTDYYMVTLMTEGGGGDSLTVGVITPNSDSSLPNQKPQVQKIDIVNTPQRQVLRVKVMNAIGGKFSLTFMERNAETKEVSYLKTTDKLDNDVECDRLSDRIRRKVGTHSTCVREALDENENVVTDLTDAKGFQWTLTFNSHRSRPIVPSVNFSELIGDQIKTEATEMTPQSDPVRGSFKLRYGDCVTPNIQYHHDQWHLDGKLEDCYLLAGGVTVYTHGNNNDGKAWHVVMDSISGKSLDLVVEENNLTGGAGDTTPELVITPEFEPSVPALVYLPIPSEFLRTVSKSPQLVLTVDGLMGGCDRDDCAYTFLPPEETPTITKYTLTGTTLEITMGDITPVTPPPEETTNDQNTNPERILEAQTDPGATMETIKVRFAGVDCVVSSVAWPVISCEMPVNDDNSVQMEAGSFTPQVHLDGKGYFNVDDDVSPTVVDLTIVSVSPDKGSFGGGTHITIMGTGFAADSNYRNTNTVTVNDAPCQISEFYTNKIVCETPEKKDQLNTTTLKIVVNGLEVTTSDFAYDLSITPKIDSLSPDSASPMLKNDLVINGSEFGSDTSMFSVSIKSKEADGDEYLCNVTSGSDSSVTCRLSGGKKGKYSVKLHKKGVGYSIPNTVDADAFAYSTTVTSISPKFGSTEGGTLLTITGTNFSPIQNQNQVVIGDTGNDVCLIETASTTELTCRVQKQKEPLYDELDVYVLAQIQVEADCVNDTTCKFTFDESLTPKVSSLSPTDVATGSTVKVIGTGFDVDAGEIKVSVGGVDVGAVSKISDTEFNFTMPALPFSSHQPEILIGNKGYAKFDEVTMLNNALRINSISPTRGSKYGEFLTIQGNGFQKDATRVLMNNKECRITSLTETQIECTIPQLDKQSKEYEVSIEFSDGKETDQTVKCEDCKYSTDDYVPRIRSLDGEGPYTAGKVELLVDGDYLKTTKQDDAVAYDVADLRVWMRTTQPEKYGEYEKEGVVEFHASGVKLVFDDMTAGVYNIVYHIKNVGFARVDSPGLNLVVNPVISDIPSINSSLGGGQSLVINGQGFPTMSSIDRTLVTVCDEKCRITDMSFSQITCQTPVLNTKDVQDNFNLMSPAIQRNAVVHGDKQHWSMERLIDGNRDTYFSGRPWDYTIQFDFGENSLVRASEIRLIPRSDSPEINLADGRFEGSIDGDNWTTFATVDESVFEGVNVFKPNLQQGEVWEFRFLRFVDARNHMYITEIEVYGFHFKDVAGFNLSSHGCDVKVSVLGSDQSVEESKVVYKADETPEVTGLSPNMGTTIGGTLLTISGKKFESDSEVTIDGIACVINSVSSSEITCTTGDRPTFRESTFEVFSPSKGFAATHGHKYLYIDRWSDQLVWGGEAPPREGDSIHVPKGQILLVDVSPPPLYMVLVEGTLIFADEQDQTFEAWFIIVREGTFKIGSLENPHQHKLTITLHGTRESKMLPGFGNKSIMVHNGHIEIHGKPVNKTWTMLDKPVCPGATEITVTDEVDWKVGDQILLSPTGRSRNEVEERFITKIEGRVITLDQPASFYHFAGNVYPHAQLTGDADSLSVNTVDGASLAVNDRTIDCANPDWTPLNASEQGDSITIRGEVALLTRNVLIRGDESAKVTGHGAHIMVRGKGKSFARFSYFEMFLAGQKFQLGRYPIHYHMMGEVDGMFIRGVSVHHTFNRGTTIHGTHNLLLEWNVYYRTMGHTIFLEDGIEKNNVIQYNLVVHVSPSSSMLMSDMDPAGLWQARPTNFIRNNHFVGSAGNGAWFELVGGPTGPSAAFGRGICSSSDHLVQYDNNVHHSNSLGLRVYPIYVPKTRPCEGGFNGTLRNPWSQNPGMPAQYKNNIYYMNGLGTFGKFIGAIQYIDSFWISNGTNQLISQPNGAADSLARNEGGMSIGFSELTSFHRSSNGNIRFRTGQALSFGNKSGFMAKDQKFFNFVGGTFSSYCGSCSNEKKRVAGGVRQNFNNVSFKNVSFRIIQWADPLYYKSIVYDKDGSLMAVMKVPDDRKAEFSSGGWITSWFPHLNIPECFKQEDTSVCSDACAVCNSTIRLKTLKHTVLDNAHMMYGQDMKLFNLGRFDDPNDHPDFNFDMNLTEDTSPDGVHDNEKFGFNKFRNCQLSMNWRGWLSVIATGYRYNYHFGRGVEWKKMKTQNDWYWGWEGTELPVYLRHNHTEHRELYDNWFFGIDENDEYTDWRKMKLEDSVDKANEVLNDSHSFGRYFYDKDNETILWKIDEKRLGTVESEAIYCRHECPEEEIPPEEPDAQVDKYWNKPEDWTSGAVPIENEVVEIPREWKMHVNTKTAKLKKLKILGTVVIDPDTDDAEIHSHLIEINLGGQLLAGTQDKPHSRNAKIVLYGKKSDDDLVISELIAPVNKAIVNKGEMKLYAESPAVKWARLAQKVSVGDKHFLLTEVNHGWKAGDQIVVASSSTKEEERELMTIESIVDGTNEIRTVEAFKYLHYGSGDTVITTQGPLDMRAEVGHLTRKIVIEANNDDGDEWGCTILTPNIPLLNDGGRLIQGQLELDGVEIKHCGQRDTKKAAIDMNWVSKTLSKHKVINSSFNDLQGWALNMFNAEGLTFSHNVVYNARKYGIFLQNIKAVFIEHNLIVGIKIRDNYDNREYWDMYIGIYYNDTATHLDGNGKKEDEIVIRHNSVSSAPWFGYAVPGYSCDDKILKEDVNFFNNTAHSCKGGWIPTNMDEFKNDCVQFSYFNSYKNDEQGFVQRADVKNIVVDHFILADNRNALVINGGDGKQYPSVVFRDSSIIGKALGDCNECYQGASECETNGMISSLFNKSPYDFYFEKTRMPLHNSTNVHFSFGGKQLVDTVDFVNFNDEYECGQKSIAIKMNNFYQDNANFITLRKLNVTDVLDPYLFYFPNHKKHLDSSAYCGRRDCTGNYNLMFYDSDGSIFGEGKPMHFFGNNLGAGRDGDCTFFSEWNGHACNPEYAQMLLTWRGDSRGLVIFPLMLKIEDYQEDKPDELKFYHETDSPRQVTSLVKRFSTTTVTTSQTMPTGMTYQMFTQNDTDWVIYKVQAENPATMTVLIQDPLDPDSEPEIKDPILLEVDEVLDMKQHVTDCGANYYRASDRMLWFVVVGSNCKVTVEFANSLQLSTRLNIDPETFWDSGGIADFKQKLMALLEIPAHRIRVVGIRRGSTIVDTVILSKKKVEEERNNKEEVKEEFQTFLQKFETAVANEEIDLGAPVLDIKNEMAIDNVDPVTETEDTTTDTDNGDQTETENPNTSSNNMTRNILIGVLVPIGIIILGVAAWCIYKKCAGGSKPGQYQENSSRFGNETRDLTSQRENEMANFVINNAGGKKFGGNSGGIKMKRQMSLNPESKIDSYIKRRN